jgi:hypothetical protein
VKRVLTVLLSAALLCGTFAFGASAEEPLVSTKGLACFWQTVTLTDPLYGTSVYDYHKAIAFGKEKLPLIVYYHGMLPSWQSDDWAGKFQMIPIQLAMAMRAKRCHILAAHVEDDTSWESDGETEAAGRAIEWAAAQGNVDLNRVYIVGYSMGGRSIEAQTAAYPDRYAAALHFDTVSADSYERSIPHHIAYPRAGGIWSADDVRRLQAQGLDVTATEVAAGGHNTIILLAPFYAGWVKWLFAQTK